MADNIAISAGTGTTVATDNIGGVNYQRIKMALGADGVAVDAGAGAGVVGTDTQRVTLASDDPAVATLGATTGTKVITDANGTIQQYLRGLVSLIAAGAAAISKAEDVASADADVGVPSMAVRKATPANTSGTDGDYEMLQISAGRLWASATIDAALPAGAAYIGHVGGTTFGPLNTRKTRPNDTSAYIAYDTINESTSAGTVWTFTSIARISGGSGVILRAHVETSHTANTARLALDIYNSSITAVNDNAEATRLTGNVANFVGTISFPALVKTTTNSTVAEADADVRIPFLTSGSANLFGVLRATDAFTPTASSTYDINLSGIQD